MPLDKNDILQRNINAPCLEDVTARFHAWMGRTVHVLPQVEEGSLYPALHRMEQEGWIVAEWGMSDNNRRARYYRLTAAGHKQLVVEEKQWAKLTNAVAQVLSLADSEV
jgi:DNA-binding PadR family transcriptional regulator